MITYGELKLAQEQGKQQAIIIKQGKPEAIKVYMEALLEELHLCRSCWLCEPPCHCDNDE